jgi:hypothetical protein
MEFGRRYRSNAWTAFSPRHPDRLSQSLPCEFRIWLFRLQLFYTAGSDARSRKMNSTQTVQIVAGVLCLVIVAIIILRRKGKKSKDTDEEF